MRMTPAEKLRKCSPCKACTHAADTPHPCPPPIWAAVKKKKNPWTLPGDFTDVRGRMCGFKALWPVWNSNVWISQKAQENNIQLLMVFFRNSSLLVACIYTEMPPTKFKTSKQSKLSTSGPHSPFTHEQKCFLNNIWVVSLLHVSFDRVSDNGVPLAVQVSHFLSCDPESGPQCGAQYHLWL